MAEVELRTRLRAGPLLCDGGLGTLLIGIGLARGCAPERWNLERPEQVEAAHRAYVAAGSEIITTNSFGGTPHKLEAVGLSRGRCVEVNAAAVEIAKRAAGDAALVAGDVGPSGLMLPPMGGATEQQLRDELGAQIEALCAAGADLLFFETFFDLRECVAALTTARALTALPIFCTMTFETKRRGTHTIVGDPLVPTLARLVELGADAVGCNCSVTPELMRPMIAAARAELSAPLIAQPNAGKPRAGGGAAPSYELDPERFAGEMMAIVEAGATVVGGCCGTDPATIAALRRQLDAVPR